MFGNLFSQCVTSIFDELTPELTGIFDAAKSYSLSDWRDEQLAIASIAGAAGSAIPLSGLVTMPADVAILVNRMAVCSYGLGAIIGVAKGRGNVLEREDMAVILARWAGDCDVSNAAVAKASASLVGKIGGKATSSFLAKTMAEKAGLLVGKKLGGKLGALLGIQFGTQFLGKAATSWIPFVNAGVSAGVNAYFVDGIATAAEEWYRLKVAK